MYLEEKLLFIRLNRFDFYKLTLVNLNSPIGTRLSNLLKKEYGYAKVSKPSYLLPPFIKLYQKMYTNGPNGDETALSKSGMQGHYQKITKAKHIPDIITSSGQVPFI